MGFVPRVAYEIFVGFAGSLVERIASGLPLATAMSIRMALSTAASIRIKRNSGGYVEWCLKITLSIVARSKMAASTLSIAASIRMHSSTATLLLVSVIFCLFQCFILLDQTPDLYFLLFIGL